MADGELEIEMTVEKLDVGFFPSIKYKRNGEVIGMSTPIHNAQPRVHSSQERKRWNNLLKIAKLEAVERAKQASKEGGDAK